LAQQWLDNVLKHLKVKIIKAASQNLIELLSLLPLELILTGLTQHVILSDQRERRISQNGAVKPRYWEILHFAALVQNDMRKSYLKI
jgi:hypothetical protein